MGLCCEAQRDSLECVKDCAIEGETDDGGGDGDGKEDVGAAVEEEGEGRDDVEYPFSCRSDSDGPPRLPVCAPDRSCEQCTPDVAGACVGDRPARDPWSLSCVSCKSDRQIRSRDPLDRLSADLA